MAKIVIETPEDLGGCPRAAGVYLVGAFAVARHRDVEDALIDAHEVPAEALSVSVSLDRASVPMEGPRPAGRAPEEGIVGQNRPPRCRHHYLKSHSENANLMNCPRVRGAVGLPDESREMFDLAREACGPRCARAWDLWLHRGAATRFGWRAVGRVACWGDRFRRSPA